MTMIPLKSLGKWPFERPREEHLKGEAPSISLRECLDSSHGGLRVVASDREHWHALTQGGVSLVLPGERKGDPLKWLDPSDEKKGKLS